MNVNVFYLYLSDICLSEGKKIFPFKSGEREGISLHQKLILNIFFLIS